MKDRISEMGRRGSSVGPDGSPAGRVTLRVVGLDRMNTYQPNSGRSTVSLNYDVINTDSAKRSRFSQLRERRKSLGAVLAKHEVSEHCSANVERTLYEQLANVLYFRLMYHYHIDPGGPVSESKWSILILELCLVGVKFHYQQYPI